MYMRQLCGEFHLYWRADGNLVFVGELEGVGVWDQIRECLD